MCCVFLGYNTQHKGYKCLDAATGRVYISGDVVFDETIFPFSELHPNVGPLLRSEISLLPPTLLNPCGESGLGIANVTNAADPNRLVATENRGVSGTNLGENTGETRSEAAHGMDLPATADPDANPGVASLLSDPSADQVADGFSKTLSMRKI